MKLTNENISTFLFNHLPEDQCKEVMTASNECDMEPCFMGFAKTYSLLAELIPTDWTVIDIGAAFAPQCYFFRNHAKYIAVEPCTNKMFHMDNTVIYRNSAKGFIEKTLPSLNLDINKVFAICNFVPDWYGENPQKLTRATFKNCYCFYPNPRENILI